MRDINTLQAAIANFATAAAFRLRRSGQLTKKAGIFLATNRHKPGYQQLSKDVVFMQPTADTGQIIARLVSALHELLADNEYQTGFYRAGVFLHDFIPAHALQVDLLGAVSPAAHDAQKSRMAAVDRLNEKFGKNRVHYAAQALGKTWEPRQNLKSPRYVSNWSELPYIKPI